MKLKDKIKTPDTLNSKIKRLHIELPHYSFSHSSAGDTSNEFIGRTRLVSRLQRLIEDDTDKTGVYLVAGNRGVGKTSLVNHVANQTSLRQRSAFNENLRISLLLLLSVVGVQFLLQVFDTPRKYPIAIEIISFWTFVTSFMLLCRFNSYNRKCAKRTELENFIKKGAKYAVEELKCLINPLYPYGIYCSTISSFDLYVFQIQKRKIA